MIDIRSLIAASAALDWPAMQLAPIEPGPRKVVKNPNSATYKPNGECECARRRRQIHRGRLIVKESQGTDNFIYLTRRGRAALRAENGVSNT